MQTEEQKQGRPGNKAKRKVTFAITLLNKRGVDILSRLLFLGDYGTLYTHACPLISGNSQLATLPRLQLPLGGMQHASMR